MGAVDGPVVEGNGVAGFHGPLQDLEPVGIGVGVGRRLEAPAVGGGVVAVEAVSRCPADRVDGLVPEV